MADDDAAFLELAERAGPAPAIESMIQPAPRPNDERGITLDMPFGTYNDEVVNPAEVDIPDLLNRISVMLRTDGHFKALFRLLSLPFRQAKWSMVPDEDGEEEAQFIEDMLTRPPYQGGMTTSFDSTRALAARAFAQGFQVWEEVYTYAEMPGYDRPMLVLRKLAPRESRTIKFKADDHGGFAGVTQRASDKNGGMRTIDIPRDKVLFFTVDKEEHPFYGRSMFEPALYHFDKKHKLYYIAHIAAQITAVPGRVASQDGQGGANELKAHEKAQLKQALADFGFNSAMLLPKGITLTEFGKGGSEGLKGILELINHHNIQASQSILAQFIDLGQQGGGGGGSYALSKDSSDIFLMASQALLDSWAETLNWHLIPKFIDWNFGTKKYPRIQFEPLADNTKIALMEVFKTLATAAATQVTPEFIWELEQRAADMLGLEVDYEAIQEEKDQLAEQADVVTQALAMLEGEGLGLDPALDPASPIGDPAAEPPANLSDPMAIFLAEDYHIVELATFRATDPSNYNTETVEQSKSRKEREASRQRRQREKSKRDKMGQFSRVNEVSSGAGMGGASGLAPLVTDVQGRLDGLGYDLGEPGVDGKFGPITAKAVAAFQSDNGLPVTGKVDMGTYAMLLEMAPKQGKTRKEDPAKAKGDNKPPTAAKDLGDLAKRLRDNRKSKGAKGVQED